MRYLIVLAAILLALMLAAAADADPPAGPPGEFSDWYHSLKQPDTGVGCCSLSDCRKPKYRVVDGNYEVFIDETTYGFEAPNEWVRVPPDKILQHTQNPVGAAIACWRKAYGIMCFVRDWEA